MASQLAKFVRKNNFRITEESDGSILAEHRIITSIDCCSPYNLLHIGIITLKDGFHILLFLNDYRLSSFNCVPRFRGTFPHFLHEFAVPSLTVCFEVLEDLLGLLVRAQSRFHDQGKTLPSAFYSTLGYWKRAECPDVWQSPLDRHTLTQSDATKLMIMTQNAAMLSQSISSSQEQASEQRNLLTRLKQDPRPCVRDWASTYLSKLDSEESYTPRKSETQTKPNIGSNSQKTQNPSTPATARGDGAPMET